MRYKNGFGEESADLYYIDIWREKTMRRVQFLSRRIILATRDAALPLCRGREIFGFFIDTRDPLMIRLTKSSSLTAFGDDRDRFLLLPISANAFCGVPSALILVLNGAFGI